MSHPNRMLTARELANFRLFMKGPEGAFDSAPTRPRRRGVPLAAFGPGGLYDRHRIAKDEAPDDNEAARPRNAMAMLRQIALKSSPEEWAELRDQLCALGGGEAEDDEPTAMQRELDGDLDSDPADNRNRTALDEPPPFPGRPRPGGAMDGLDRLIAAVGADPWPQARPIPQRHAMDGADDDSFGTMFPDAMRIG